MNQIVVLNAGGQYCHLIARRIRELGVHAVVADIDRPASEFEGVRGIIISGGPASVTEATCAGRVSRSWPKSVTSSYRECWTPIAYSKRS